MSDIESLSIQALADIAAAETPDTLEALRIIRAPALGRYCSSITAASIRARVAALT